MRVATIDCRGPLQALETTLRRRLIPSLTGQPASNDETRNLLALLARHRGMGIINPCLLPTIQHVASKEVCEPLVKLIRWQIGNVFEAVQEQQEKSTRCEANDPLRPELLL